MDDRELFVYMGVVGDTIYYSHAQRHAMSREKIGEMCAQVYNALIHKNFVTRPQNLIIYNWLQETGETWVTNVIHRDFGRRTYPTGELESNWVNLMRMDEERINMPMMPTISARIVNGEAVVLNVFDIMEITALGKEANLSKNFAFGPITIYMSSKPLLGNDA